MKKELERQTSKCPFLSVSSLGRRFQEMPRKKIKKTFLLDVFEKVYKKIKL
jgi:hypothetical protein